METPLPSNETLLKYSEAVNWEEVERKKRKFNEVLAEVKNTGNGHLPLDLFSEATGTEVTTVYDPDDTQSANVLVMQVNGQPVVLASAISARYRAGRTINQVLKPYNLNPAVNHTNIHQTDDPDTHLRAIGAELELGLFHPDGTPPGENEMQVYIEKYQQHARRLGITPQVDREACQYQVETHVAPGVGYHRTRQALEGIMYALAQSSAATGLQTAVMSAYPIESDFKLSQDRKVQTAVDLMVDVNHQFPEYEERLQQVRDRFHMAPDTNFVEAFRLQGCHIHLDLAGRSEALGLLTFYTMLRSATAIANAAVLKGGPFVNGTCDEELLCTREYLRRSTVTGRYLEMPLSPHLIPDGMDKFAGLLKSERVNAMARAMLYENGLGSPVSVMHNPIGRVRPDLGTTKRICTVESTGMPVNISASRQAAILTDFEYSHVIIESYFRKHGCDLEPMYDDHELWALLGPLNTSSYIQQQNRSDRVGTDIEIETATGEHMTLAEFYERKRVYMHKHLMDVVYISPRDIDDVYMSLQRMLAPPSGQVAQTPEHYIGDYKLRSTGNWGQILRNAFIEEGGTPGTHAPDIVLQVANRVHNALQNRYKDGM